ncbi:MAG: hypothetical protein ACXW19_07220 [Thermoanaerobaculia bacterium]
MKQNPLTIAGLMIILIIVFAAIFGSSTFAPGYCAASEEMNRASTQSFASTDRVTSPFLRQITNAVSNSVS